MKLFSVVFVFAKLFVDKRSDKDNVRKDIKPEHKNDYRSKGTVDCGIIYGRTYEPGEKTAYNGENKRTEDRSGKNVYVIWASPCVAVINGIKHSGGNDIQNYEAEPVPKICKVKKIYKIDKRKERLKKVNKPSSADNCDSEDINSNKKSYCVNKAESKTQSVASAAAFENFAKSIRKNSESGSAGDDCRRNTDDQKTAGLRTGIGKIIFDY